MASLDNVQDLIEKLEKDKFDFLVISLQKGKTNNKADVSLRIPNKKSATIMLDVLAEIVQILAGIVESKPRKKRRKKK